jgi:hypothetical protein
MGIVIWLIGMFIFFAILYSIIQGAINNSRMARDIEEIKELLQTLVRDKTNNSPPR